MKLPSPLIEVTVFLLISMQKCNSQKPGTHEMDPLLRLLMNNPIYREHLLDPPSRKQDTLLKILRHSGASDQKVQNIQPPQNSLSNDKSRQSKELLVAPAYTQDPLLRQLLSKYHEDFLSVLIPPHHKDNPLFQQLSSKVNSKNPLLRDLPSSKQVL